jgi:hypothetical protein
MLPWKDGDLLMIYRFTYGKWWKMVKNGDFHCPFTVRVGT